MKNKKILIIGIIIVIFFSISGLIFYKSYTDKQYEKLTVKEKFEKHDYSYVNDGDYIKNLNTTDYYLFNLNSLVPYFTIEINGQYEMYFFQNDWANIENCEYDFKKKKERDDTSCSDDQIEKLTLLKTNFNEELQKIKIDTDDLLKEKALDTN
ncbi:MAG: hypothetical protein PHI05_03010 [Bacilli bacterium]|nr:hypothetical protein [Bacilli bacterium]